MLSHMDEVLGTRYCEPTAMKANMIMTKAMQLIMKGTFNRAEVQPRRMFNLDQLVEHLPRADILQLQPHRQAAGCTRSTFQPRVIDYQHAAAAASMAAASNSTSTASDSTPASDYT